MNPQASRVDGFLLAEECPSPLFMGWHLYFRQRRQGRNDNGEFGWIRRECIWTHAVRDFVATIDSTAPALPYGRDTFEEIELWDRFVKWFATRFPKGIAVSWTGDPPKDWQERKQVSLISE